MPNTDVANARQAAQKVCAAFGAVENKGVSFSVGIAQAGPEAFPDMDSLVKEADGCMYEAKAASRKDPGFHIRPQGE